MIATVNYHSSFRLPWCPYGRIRSAYCHSQPTASLAQAPCAPPPPAALRPCIPRFQLRQLLHQLAYVITPLWQQCSGASMGCRVEFQRVKYDPLSHCCSSHGSMSAKGGCFWSFGESVNATPISGHFIPSDGSSNRIPLSASGQYRLSHL